MNMNEDKKRYDTWIININGDDFMLKVSNISVYGIPKVIKYARILHDSIDN